MVAYRTFLDTVSQVVCTLDVIEQADFTVLVDSMINTSIRYVDAVEVLQKMERSGLLVFDGGVIAITPKGRYLAGDIRDLTAKQVRP